MLSPEPGGAHALSRGASFSEDELSCIGSDEGGLGLTQACSQMHGLCGIS